MTDVSYALASRVVRSAQIQAFRNPITSSPPLGFRGGLILNDGLEDSRLRHTRFWRPCDSFDVNFQPSQHLEGEFAYLGPVDTSFGHLMSEFIHRAIYSKQVRPHGKFILVGVRDAGRKIQFEIPEYVDEIYNFLGIHQSNRVVISDDCTVDNLFVCEQGSDLGGGPKPRYLDLLDEFTISRLDQLKDKVQKPLKTYVSRSALKAGGFILGESYIESLLAVEGYHIFRPESHSFYDQLNIYRSSQVLIFSEGAACHGVELFGNQVLNECHLIGRSSACHDVYRRVFAYRCKKFSYYPGAVPVASVAICPTGRNLADHLSVSVLECSKFIEYMKLHDLAKLTSFDINNYIASVKKDFESYIEYHRKVGSYMISPSEVATTRRFLDLMMDRMLASDPDFRSGIVAREPSHSVCWSDSRPG